MAINVRNLSLRYPFEPGAIYSRLEIFAAVGLSDVPKGGNWYTGYTEHDGVFFIFCNIGTAGRTGHDYMNTWEDEELIWYGKSQTHLAQPQIKRLLSKSSEVYLFWRTDNRQPFTFAGLGEAVSADSARPVRLRWRFK
jgi:5-methylcytosine-specific restriction protein A